MDDEKERESPGGGTRAPCQVRARAQPDRVVEERIARQIRAQCLAMPHPLVAGESAVPTRSNQQRLAIVGQGEAHRLDRGGDRSHHGQRLAQVITS